jgi:hypothetical protein
MSVNVPINPLFMTGRGAQISGYDPVDDMLRVKSVQKKMRDSFTSPLTDKWDVITADGATATNASGILTIASGVTAAGYVELLSKEQFTIPFRAMFGVQNTRHANNHQLIEMVSVNPDTGRPDGRHSIDVDMGGAASVTATQLVYGVQNGGLRSLRSAASTIVSTATYSVIELEPFSDEVYFHSRTIDATTGRSNSYVRHQQIPDPSAYYKLRVRSINASAWTDTITNAIAGTGGVIRLTANAHGRTTGNVIWVEQLVGVTNNGALVDGKYTVTVVDVNTLELQGTTFAGAYVAGSGRWALTAAPTAVNFQFQFVNCQDYAELTAEITAGRGQIVEGQAIAARTVTGSVVTATISGTPAVTATTSPLASTVHSLNAAATTNATSVKATAGRVMSLVLTNMSASTKWFKMFQKASAPAVGTDVPVIVIPIPANANVSLNCGDSGIQFGTGIAYSITGAQADADTTALALGDVKVFMGYV